MGVGLEVAHEFEYGPPGGAEEMHLGGVFMNRSPHHPCAAERAEIGRPEQDEPSLGRPRNGGGAQQKQHAQDSASVRHVFGFHRIDHDRMSF